MLANPRNPTSLMTKTLGLLLGGLLVLAPGAAAQGALDVSGTIHGAARAQGDLSGATSAAYDALNQVQYQAQGALSAVDSVKADVNLEANVEADARAPIEGVKQAGMGFVATARGYFDGLLQGVLGLFGQAKSQAEITTTDAIDAAGSVRSEVDAEVKSGAQYGQSFEMPELPSPPPPPRVSASLTASLQAAIAGVLTLF